MAACLSFLLPVGVPVVLLLHAHHHHGLHAHVSGTTVAAATPHEGRHGPRHEHPVGGEPRVVEDGVPPAAPGIVLVLEREGDTAPAPTPVLAGGGGEPPIDAATPPDTSSPDVRRASADPRVRARPPPPRRGLERLLSTSHALLL